MRKYLVSLLLCTLLISCASHKQYQSPEIRKEEVKTEKNKLKPKRIRRKIAL